MFNLKNNKNDSMKFAKKKKKLQSKIKIKFQKIGYFFAQHPLVEKSPPATGKYINDSRRINLYIK